MSVGYAIEIYVGEKRSGKTLTMVADTYHDIELDESWTVYSNIKLNRKYFPNYKTIDKKSIQDYYKNKDKFKKCIFMIDEIHTVLDSRDAMKGESKKITYFLGQMGKRGNIFRGTTHFPHMLEYRLRSYCERWKYIRKGLITNNTWKPILNNNRVLTSDENNRYYVQVKPMIQKLKYYEFVDMFEPTYYIRAKKYFDFYDTEELIE